MDLCGLYVLCKKELKKALDRFLEIGKERNTAPVSADAAMSIYTACIIETTLSSFAVCTVSQYRAQSVINPLRFMNKSPR